MAGTPDDMADSSGDRQAGTSLPLSALLAGSEEEKGVKEDAAATTIRQTVLAGSTAITSPPSPSTIPFAPSAI